MSTLESTQNLPGQQLHSLNVFFAPKNVAVIGATETPGSVGRTLLWNLMTNPFGGTVYPVNPKRPNVLGIKAYPRIGEVPERVDLAVIATPAPSVPGVVGECVDAGVKGAVIITAGFSEAGAQGKELERQALAEARRGRMRIVGPNCLGVMSPLTGLNATFAATIARPGNVAFLSQSGALLTAILDWSMRELVGFSAFISMGAMMDVGWGDMIDYLGDDPRTRSIVCYMETIGDARSFLSAAREVALTKPIIVIKAGRTEAAAKAAASHTGSLAGSDEVLDAAFQRCGVLRVNSIADLFYMAEILAKQPRPKGPRLTILTNAGGPGVLATDALLTNDAELAALSDETIEAMNAILPPHWSHSNPIDILGDAGPDRYAKSVEIAAKDPNSDGLLVILTPQAMTDPTQTAEQLKAYAQIQDKPILASWMGGADVAAGETILNKANIPTFAYPDTAARAFAYMWQFSDNLRGLYETPQRPLASPENTQARDIATQIAETVRKSGRPILTEIESKQLLSAYGIPITPTVLASSENDAVARAEELGYPVVLKIYSETITHKTDVGGVKLNLMSSDEVRAAYRAIEDSVREKVGAEHFQGVTVQPMVKMKDAYEIILGSSLDSQFGPVLLFGAGGQLVEVFQDRALALPPLNTTLARRLMERTRIYKALKGVRGRKPVDLAALEQLIVGFSDLIVENRWIAELDINPLLVSPDGFLALDARVVAVAPDVDTKDLPRLAIRPYPTQYISHYSMGDSQVTIRPIRPDDEPLMVRFHESLSEETVYMRYFHLIKLSQRVTHERLTRICFNDYDRELALVVEYQNAETGAPEIVGVGRLSKQHSVPEAEFSLVVSDRYQGKGLGSALMQRLVQIARDENLTRLQAEILPENVGMQRLCEKLGFQLERTEDVVKAELTL